MIVSMDLSKTAYTFLFKILVISICAEAHFLGKNILVTLYILKTLDMFGIKPLNADRTFFRTTLI